MGKLYILHISRVLTQGQPATELIKDIFVRRGTQKDWVPFSFVEVLDCALTTQNRFDFNIRWALHPVLPWRIQDRRCKRIDDRYYIYRICRYHKSYAFREL